VWAGEEEARSDLASGLLDFPINFTSSQERFLTCSAIARHLPTKSGSALSKRLLIDIGLLFLAKRSAPCSHRLSIPPFGLTPSCLRAGKHYFTHNSISTA